MPLVKIIDVQTGESGFKWGESGIRYFGENAKEKALKQGSIIEDLKTKNPKPKVTIIDVKDSNETSDLSDHDLLIGLHIGFNHLKDDMKDLKESIIGRSDVYAITNKVLKDHCETKHNKGRSSISWDSVFKLLVATIPLLIGGALVAWGIS